MNLSDTQKEFLISEYNSLREELLLDIQQITETEKYGLILSGAIWAWLLTQPWIPSLTIALLLPALITKFMQFKRKRLAKAIGELAQYIYKIEEVFHIKETSGSLLGWEHRKQGEPIFRNWSKAYWNLLFWGNILLAIAYLVAQFI